MDTATSDIRAVQFTPSRDCDRPVLPDLLEQIPMGENIGTVTADGSYDTRKCHDVITDRGAHTVIPLRKNAKPSKTITAYDVAPNRALRTSRCRGHALWQRWSAHHRRNRVGTKMHCVQLFGWRLIALGSDRRVANSRSVSSCLTAIPCWEYA